MNWLCRFVAAVRDRAVDSYQGRWFRKQASYHNVSHDGYSHLVPGRALGLDGLENGAQFNQAVFMSIMRTKGTTTTNAQIARYEQTRRTLGEQQACVVFLQFLEGASTFQGVEDLDLDHDNDWGVGVATQTRETTVSEILANAS
eukprot:CAMPEP_0185197152 /NCGR_PEP_ID=MMETSP1140-20130426/39652_1 /TAXON_ID=298111 /ORGANISM="Pavlova sp., Strain CCMP459" /LENGTH=143 /DNA_ID=CAMNT_0027764247 /DNA_START=628 /DNA_END=1062 /DNA_ORIENTATION=-